MLFEYFCFLSFLLSCGLVGFFSIMFGSNFRGEVQITLVFYVFCSLFLELSFEAPACVLSPLLARFHLSFAEFLGPENGSNMCSKFCLKCFGGAS